MDDLCDETRLRRRTLLLGVSSVAVGGVMARAACSSAQLAEARAATDLSTWPGVRREFELDPEFIHLGSMFIASHPRRVRRGRCQTIRPEEGVRRFVRRRGIRRKRWC